MVSMTRSPATVSSTERRAAPHRAQLETLLRGTGVQLNGDRPWDPQIHDPRFYPRVLAEGSLGLGESYMDGWWDCEALDEMVSRLLRAQVDHAMRGWQDVLRVLTARLVNRQTLSRAREVGRQHYDIGNALYERMLGRYMMYSCGYWDGAADLDDAQRRKMNLIARKLGVERGMRVLDIGCGWGEMARFLADEYGAEVVGVTISERQAEYGRQLCAGLPVEIRLQDYRELDERFDRIVSIGMFEHVGARNYRTFMEQARHLLDPEHGRLLLHTIGSNRTTTRTDPWLERYIFPNSHLPSERQVTRAAGERWIMEDWHNFGADYDPTLCAWYANFEAAWPELEADYGETFFRMWRYYLLACAGSFRARKNQLWQIVYSPNGIPGGYRAPR